MAGRNGGDPDTFESIRDAALREYAETGDAASIADLREAIDEHVLSIAADAFAGLDPDGADGDVFEVLAERVTAVVREHPDALVYVARSAIDGEPGGLGIFDAFVAIATAQLEALREAGRLDPDLDLQWAALHVVIFNLSTLLFREAIENHVPEPLDTAPGLERWHNADTRLFRRGFLRAAERR
jgi:hypothetical protein